MIGDKINYLVDIHHVFLFFKLGRACQSRRIAGDLKKAGEVHVCQRAWMGVMECMHDW
jgi:hypothetical protein